MDSIAEGPPRQGRHAGPPTITDRFAANLRGLRGQAKLSQEELAFRAALHRTQISLLETGQRLPRCETLVKLAGAVGATPNDLLSGIEWEPVIATGGHKIVAPGGLVEHG